MRGVAKRRKKERVFRRTKGECHAMLFSMGNARICSVSFSDHAGVRHTAQVTAETLYEAAVLGLKAISEEWAEEPGAVTPIEIQVQLPAVKHELRMRHIRQWLDSNCTSPKEKALKERLKGLLI